MPGHDLLHNGQPQPGACTLALIESGKPAQRPLPLSWGNARSLIADAHAVAVGLEAAQRHRSEHRRRAGAEQHEPQPGGESEGVEHETERLRDKHPGAGGADNDSTFGQLGDDTIQGDGSIDGATFDGGGGFWESGTVDAIDPVAAEASVEPYVEKAAPTAAIAEPAPVGLDAPGIDLPAETVGARKYWPIYAAAEAGVDALLTVDIPPEEAELFVPALRAKDIDPIFLLAPTSNRARIERITRAASGFVYYVSLKGVTGAANLSLDSVHAKLDEIREVTRLPVGVGFGIKDAETAAAMAPATAVSSGHGLSVRNLGCALAAVIHPVIGTASSNRLGPGRGHGGSCVCKRSVG